MSGVKVTVVVFGMLRDHLPPGSPQNRAVVELEDGATVGDVAEALQIPVKAVFATLLDGEPADRVSSVQDGSEVTLMPPFTGGSRQARGVESSDG